MLFGIDYDGTWTEAPELFKWFVGMVRSHGHDAVVVTRRGDPGDPGFEAQPVKDEIDGLCPIVFCGQRRNDKAAADAGYEVDIWIDDHPHLITNDLPEVSERNEVHWGNKDSENPQETDVINYHISQLRNYLKRAGLGWLSDQLWRVHVWRKPPIHLGAPPSAVAAFDRTFGQFAIYADNFLEHRGGVIRIREAEKDSLFHELAHYVWGRHLSGEARVWYREEWKKSNQFVSSYAKSDHEEDFAENFMHFVSPKGKKLPPEAANRFMAAIQNNPLPESEMSRADELIEQEVTEAGKTKKSKYDDTI